MTRWTPDPDEAGSLARLADLRVHYDSGTLDAAELESTPLGQFRRWFDDALAAGLPEPNAMVLSTAAPDGQPSSRTVLLKDADPRGFTFFTNLESRKGRELRDNPRASVVFPWFAMHRQVVVVGTASLLSRAEVAAYFVTRPRGSRLGAWASRQSSVLEDRSVLDEAYAAADAVYGDDVPVPDFWGGWLIRPASVEFWQGRQSRLHDRLRFRATAQSASMDEPSHWTVERLSP